VPFAKGRKLKWWQPFAQVGKNMTKHSECGFTLVVAISGSFSQSWSAKAALPVVSRPRVAAVGLSTTDPASFPSKTEASRNRERLRQRLLAPTLRHPGRLKPVSFVAYLN